jgi:hypothetical protein
MPGRGAVRHNLPAELNSFVGREKERVELGRLLAATRLLTLAGTGQTGLLKRATPRPAGPSSVCAELSISKNGPG